MNHLSVQPCCSPDRGKLFVRRLVEQALIVDPAAYKSAGSGAPLRPPTQTTTCRGYLSEVNTPPPGDNQAQTNLRISGLRPTGIGTPLAKRVAFVLYTKSPLSK